MTTLLLAALVIFTLASVVTLLAVRNANDGFEDASGFHGTPAVAADSSHSTHDDHFTGVAA